MALEKKEKNVQFTSMRGPESIHIHLKELSEETGQSYASAALYYIKAGMKAEKELMAKHNIHPCNQLT